MRIHRSGGNRQLLRFALKTPMQLTRLLTISVQTFLIPLRSSPRLKPLDDALKLDVAACV